MKMSKTKKLTTIGMLCALSYAAVVIGRIPIVLFLKYDPKDVIIVIGGLIFGPLTALAVTVIVAVAQMFTISGTGLLGCLMNIVSSCSFACTASLIYKKRRKLSGAMLGLFSGLGCQAAVMMLWNYLIAPIYMGYPRDASVACTVGTKHKPPTPRRERAAFVFCKVQCGRTVARRLQVENGRLCGRAAKRMAVHKRHPTLGRYAARACRKRRR